MPDKNIVEAKDSFFSHSGSSPTKDLNKGDFMNFNNSINLTKKNNLETNKNETTFLRKLRERNKTTQSKINKEVTVQSIKAKRIDNFLKHFFLDERELIYIQTFPAKNFLYEKVVAQNFSITRNELIQNPALINKLEGLNMNQGIAFLVNSGGTKSNEIHKFNAYFIDLDSGDKSNQLELLSHSPLEPNFIVETKRGFHAYWLISDEPNSEEWIDIQKRLIGFFSKEGVEADEKMVNPNRGMRLPYLNHVSYSEANDEFEYQVVCLKNNSVDNRFTVEEMQDAFPAIPTANRKTQTSHKNHLNNNPEIDYPLMEITDFQTYQELADELRKRMKEHPSYSERSDGIWADIKGICHGGHSNSGLALNLENHSFHCRNGCETSEVFKAFNLPPVAMDILNKLERTDAGNVEALAALYGNKFRYVHEMNKWFFWSGIHWTEDKTGEINRAVIDVAKQRRKASRKAYLSENEKFAKRSENLSRINAALKIAQTDKNFSTSIEQYDQNPFLVTVQNGTLDLKTGEFRNSNQHDYITKQLGTFYDANAKASRWLQFLKDITGNNKELIEYLQTAVGYSLTGDVSEQKIFFLYGDGANGKSVFLDVISQLMGDYSATASSESFVVSKRNEANYDLAALTGKRFVTSVEFEKGRNLAESKVKLITGGDPISCRHLYGQFFIYTPQFKTWVALNHMPNIRNNDNGIWRRIVILSFNQSFLGKENKNIKEELLKELPGILIWALDGLKKWQEKGLKEPKLISDAIEEFRHQSDTVGLWIEERTVNNPNNKVKAIDAYSDYHLWAVVGGYRPLNNTNFGISLIEHGLKKEEKNDANYYIDIKLKEEEI